MKRLLALLFCTGGLFAQPIDIDPNRLVPFVITTGGNTTGATLGVPGGIEHRVDGGASARPVGRNAVTDHGADRTGAADATSAIQAAYNATPENQAMLIPAGVYKLSGGIQMNNNNRSIRGAGRKFELSSTTLTLGTGTKTLTVPSGKPWEAGIGVRIWRHLKPATYMQGTVVSYAGTTLVIDVTAVGSQTQPGVLPEGRTANHYDEIGESFSDWKVSITYLDAQNESTPAIQMGNDTDYYFGFDNKLAIDVAADAFKGDTSLQLSNASSISVGQYLRVSIKNLLSQSDLENATPARAPAFAMLGYDYLRVQLVKVTGKSGNTIDVWPPLAMDVTLDVDPVLHGYSFFREGLSVENLAIGGASTTSLPWGVINMFQCAASWIYDVDAHATPNRQIMLGKTWLCEIRYCDIGWRNGEGTNGAGILTGPESIGLLIEDNVVYGTFPAIQINGSTMASAVIATYTTNGPAFLLGASNITTNHGGHNSYVLVEHCVSYSIQSDGYHMSESSGIWHRNHMGLRSTGYLIDSRGGYFMTMIGNVLGKNNTYSGAISFGNPSFSGTHNGGTPRRQTTVGGPFYREIVPGIYLTVTSVTADSVSGTVNTGLEAPAALVVGLAPIRALSPDSHPGYVATKVSSVMTITGISGGVVTLTRGIESGGAPVVGDTYRLWPGPVGMQERDFTTSDTADERHNYLFTGLGTPGGAITSAIPSGRTLWPSITNRTTKPGYMGTYNWPPVDPTAPGDTENIIPAAGRALRLDAPAPTDPPIAASGLSATAAGATQINIVWSDNSDNETGFRLERRVGAGSWSTVTTTAANVESYSNTGLSPSTTYEYRVFAVNGGGESSASNTDSATTDAGGGGEPVFAPSINRPYKLLFRR